MKQILASIAVGIMTISTASALSFDWDITKVAFGGESLKSITTVVGYCVFLESGEYDESYTMSDTFAVSDIGTVVGTKEGTSNKIGRAHV